MGQVWTKITGSAPATGPVPVAVSASANAKPAKSAKAPHRPKSSKTTKAAEFKKARRGSAVPKVTWEQVAPKLEVVKKVSTRGRVITPSLRTQQALTSPLRHEEELVFKSPSGATKAIYRRTPPSLKNTSHFKGVCWDAKAGKWKAQITLIGGKNRHLGAFEDETEAALAFDKAAVEAFETPVLNFLPTGELNPSRKAYRPMVARKTPTKA